MTIFKAGQKVYDQVHYPDCEGKVIKVYEDSILVIFDGVENYYSLDGRSGDSLPTLSTKPYKVEFTGFEQKEHVRTYEEAVDWLKQNSKDRVIYADEAYINEEYERAFEALKKLTILRDYYNEGWKPNWKDVGDKYCLEVYEGELHFYEYSFTFRVLHFKTKGIREKFFEEQKELLEIAKPLL